MIYTCIVPLAQLTEPRCPKLCSIVCLDPAQCTRMLLGYGFK